MGQPTPSAAIDLASFDAAGAWRWIAGQLESAAASGRHPLHLVTVATIGTDGGPDARTVVLRRFDADNREVWFHTDSRSPKAAAIRRDHRVALHWYDATLRLQVRISARATLHHLDDAARLAWAASLPMSRACYTSAHAPAAILDRFPPAPVPPAAGDDSGLAHFAAVCCGFDELELLALHATGHQRARLRPAATPIAWDLLAP